MKTNINRKGISNVVATIILIAVAIALAVAVAVWVFGLAGGAAKTATLQVQAVSLTGISSGTSATLVLVVSNPSSTAIGINGFTLGGLTCTFNKTIPISSGTQGEQLQIQLSINGGQFTGASINGQSGSCTGQQAAVVGTQYSGYLTTTSGQTYPFTVTASS